MIPEPMLPTPPECGVPCGTFEALVHDNARLREENEKLEQQLAALRVDKERLVKALREIVRLYGPYGHSAADIACAAIDAARKGQP